MGTSEKKSIAVEKKEVNTTCSPDKDKKTESLITGEEDRTSVWSWICFFIFAHAIYFNENFYASLAPDMVGEVNTGFFVTFLHLPKVLFKLVSVYFVHLIPVSLRVHAFTGLSLLSSLNLILFYPSVKQIATEAAIIPASEIPFGSKRLFLAIISGILGCVAMALGEITILGYTAYFGSSTVNGWSAGSGLAGFTAAGSAILLKVIAKGKNHINHFAWFNFAIMLTMPLFFFGVLDRSYVKKKKKPQKPAQNKKVHRNVENAGLLEKMNVLFWGLKQYTLPLTFGYIVYFVVFSGFFTFVKKYNKNLDINEANTKFVPGTDKFNEQSTKSMLLFPKLFMVLRFFVFVGRSSPQFFNFYHVWTIPFFHVFSLVGMWFVVKNECPKLWSILIAIPLGLGHGFVVGFTNLCLRVKIPEHLKKFALSYINIACALGATIGNLFAIGVYKLLEKHVKLPALIK